jgi:hypothetical protein
MVADEVLAEYRAEKKLLADLIVLYWTMYPVTTLRNLSCQGVVHVR